MVISALIHNFLMKRVLIDQGNAIDILYSHAVEALGIPKSLYKSYNGVLVGFIGGRVYVEGTVNLQVTLGNQPWTKIIEVDFLVVLTHKSTYNAILDGHH